MSRDTGIAITSATMRGADDLLLTGDTWGKPPWDVIFLHGSGQTRRAWGKAPDALARCPRARAAEVPGARHMVAGDANDVYLQQIQTELETALPDWPRRDETANNG
jgi:hypothetical protein